MRVRLRTTLAMIAVAGLPLAVAGWSAVRLSEEALGARGAAFGRTGVSIREICAFFFQVRQRGKAFELRLEIACT